MVESALGEAVGKLYVEEHFSPAAKARMVELVANLVEAYRQSITTLDWMSEDTRLRALEKLGSFTPKIGYPDTWRDYSSLEIVAGDLVATSAVPVTTRSPGRSTNSASRSTATSGS